MNKIKKGELVFTTLMVLLSIGFVIGAFSYNPKPRMVPVIIGIATLVLGLISVVHDIRPIGFITRFDMDIIDLGGKLDPKKQADETIDIKLLVSIGWISGFFIVTFFLGFHFGIIAFVMAFLKIRGRVGWLKSIIMAVVAWGIVYVVFEIAMGFSLFKGIFFGEILPIL